MANDIVCMANVERYYGTRLEILANLQETAKGGKCPFCAPNIVNQLVCETMCWRVVTNHFPYKNSRLHLLILPKRHIITPADLTWQEWAGMGEAIYKATNRFPYLADGYGLALRTGEIGGVTLWHLHWHLIVPSVVEHGQIPVNFGIG